METLMKQIRVIFTGAEEENKADLGGSRDQKNPIQKAQSFKEKKKAQNWFQRQFSRKMSHDYDSREMEHAAAVAAAAFAIKSQEVSEISQQKKKSEPPETSLTETKSKMDGTKSPIFQLRGASKRFSDGKKPEKAITAAPSMKKTPTFSEPSENTDDKQPKTPAQKVSPPVQPVSLRSPPPRPPIWQTSTDPSSVRPPTPPSGTYRQTPTGPGPRERKADAWERAELEKIKVRYEKLKETIDSWENRKKMKARRKLNKEQHNELERKRVKALEKYQSKMRYINEIAQGARAQADERRRNEELKAKGKANIIRTTGKLPGACPCF